MLQLALAKIPIGLAVLCIVTVLDGARAQSTSQITDAEIAKYLIANSPWSGTYANSYNTYRWEVIFRDENGVLKARNSKVPRNSREVGEVKNLKLLNGKITFLTPGGGRIELSLDGKNLSGYMNPGAYPWVLRLHPRKN